MSLYYFELCDGVHVPDDEGQEFATLDKAREEAIKSARFMMRDEILSGTLSLRDYIRILDASRHAVAVVSFRDAVEICN